MLSSILSIIVWFVVVSGVVILIFALLGGEKTRWIVYVAGAAVLIWAVLHSVRII